MKLNVSHILLLVLSLLLFPIIGGNVDFYIVILTLSFVISSVLLGNLSLTNFKLFEKSSLTFTFLSFFCGACLWFLPIPILNYFAVYKFTYLIPISVSIVVLWVKRKKIDVNYYVKQNDFWTYSILLIIFYAIGYSPLYTSPVSIDILDPTYFNTVVASLNHTPTFDTLNQTGSKINYQIFSFFSPAAVSRYCLSSSQVSLWGMMMPYGKILFGLTLVEFIKYFSGNKKFIGIISVVAFIGISPIHLKNLIGLKLNSLYLPGLGSLLPGGNPPFTFSLTVVLLTIMYINYVTSREHKFFRSVLIISILCSVVTGMKIAAFPGMATFVVVYYFLKSRNIKFSIILSFSILLFSFLIYVFCFPITGFTKISFHFGFLIEYFSNTSATAKSLIFTAGFLCVMIGIKAVIVLFTLIKDRGDYFNLSIAAILSLLATLLIPLFLRLSIVDPNGNILENLSFDLLQFLRFGFFLLTIVCLTILLGKTSVLPTIIKRGIIIHILLVFSGYIFYTIPSLEKTNTSEYVKYKQEVKNAISEDEYLMIATFPNSNYRPQGFVADDIKYFYNTSKRKQGGYAMTAQNQYRWFEIDKLENSLVNNEFGNFKAVTNNLKNNGVNTIIFNPENVEYISDSMQSLLHSTESKYVFHIN